ncbi:Uma2 family endonuclease [uncultured Alsobacter sp.]|uniref:Uma2 family endonuclease n=1 Tax=uncultured Alsobacter sp. TaxID=1748258 RepID=UPI0025E337EE|nr:Uma2 family endonuclease [uncultured Alsobacter sp.]
MTDFAAPSLRLSFGEFVAFLDTRPDDEKWELVEGRPVLSPSPVFRHQVLVGNIILELGSVMRARRSSWAVVPGIGVKVDEFNAPVPDVMVRPLDSLEGSFCDDILVAFEVLSPGTASRDRKWKRQVYSALPSLQHYVVVSPSSIEVSHFSRSDGFAGSILKDLSTTVELSALGVALPLASLYRDTDLA